MDRAGRPGPYYPRNGTSQSQGPDQRPRIYERAYEELPGIFRASGHALKDLHGAKPLLMKLLQDPFLQPLRRQGPPTGDLHDAPGRRGASPTMIVRDARHKKILLPAMGNDLSS